ncbi:NAD(P)-dependent oxidoreductase [Sphingomonas sp. H39-1-10]|nr:MULTISPECIES: bifunctional precorrin-2 dehydrogenase/sirohydrochlorin ferrochelatase [Sphingomonas]MDF0487064.1 NAD(P)-dependent oxidoreductase [Sphingomonas pollutisoli]SDA26601.1 uroporphyrin-III C-methyltransferase / precorrin-2 dehydrogenase / sirohydrochlorin ferrochelatase [Sphingomonas sp. NFR15]
MSLASLPIFVAARGRAVILVGDGDAAAAKRRLLERAGAVVVDEDGTAALAIVAIEDETEAQAVVARLKARGVLVNAVDRPALCDFTLPAIVDRSPVIVAIGTGGVSAGLAAALRQRLEALLPPTLGRLAEALFAARGAVRARFADAGARRMALGAAFGEGGALDPFTAGPGAVERWLDHAGDVPAGLVHIRLRSGDPDDLTLREARWLAQAERLFIAGDVPDGVLARARADATRIATLPEQPLAGLTVAIHAPARPS